MTASVGMLVLFVIALAAHARPTFVAQTLDQLPTVHGVYGTCFFGGSKPLSEYADQPEVKWISASGKAFNTIHPNNAEFYLVILRMYAPLKPWIEQTWRPGEVELATP